MDTFVSRKRRRDSTEKNATPLPCGDGDEESTDFKLAILSSLHPETDTDTLLEALLIADGSVDNASQALNLRNPHVSPKKRNGGIGYQSSLTSYAIGSAASRKAIKRLTQKGRTLHLYSPEDIEAHTPCSIIHNFLPSDEADALLRELLEEAPSYHRESFKLFDNVVQSPHTMAFYVDSWDEVEVQKTEYVYNGNRIQDIRKSLPEMRKISDKVRVAVNKEIQRRIELFYPDGKKLRYQSPDEWKPNAAFVNCYDGGAENVGYHSDQLTYLGPRAVIGSLSLGVAREFRVRKVVARDDDPSPDDTSDTTQRSSGPETQARHRKADDTGTRADLEGQIAIHLPHNSLLVMHAEMQEEWKHSIAPARAIDPHPIARNKRINVTYRCYKASLHPKFTPKCRCGIPAVLRCMQKKKETRGRYMWMCHANYNPDQDGCSFFQWAEFTDDGEPPWASKIPHLLDEKSDGRNEGKPEG